MEGAGSWTRTEIGGDNKDLFHVIHKVPSGDTPYVRAKHLQVVEKDPGAAILWFWKAINARDRVDSALKDMVVVMKQQDRAEEAIEAIRSFRHLCSKQAQESLDNLLIDLCHIELSEMWKDRGTNTASKAEAAYDISWGGFQWEDIKNSTFTWKEVPNLH